MRTTAIAIMLLLAGCCGTSAEPMPDREVRYYIEVWEGHVPLAPSPTGVEEEATPGSPGGTEEMLSHLTVSFSAELWIDGERTWSVIGPVAIMTPQSNATWRREVQERLDNIPALPSNKEHWRQILNSMEWAVEGTFSVVTTIATTEMVAVALESGAVAVGKPVVDGMYMSARVLDYETDAGTGRISVHLVAKWPYTGVIEYAGELPFRTDEPIELKKVAGSHYLMPVLAQPPAEVPDNEGNESEGDATPES